MSKIYLKIFVGFWAINILTVIGQNIYVHWVNPNPESEVLSRYESDPTDRFAVRGLNLTVDAVIHSRLKNLRDGVSQAPEWIFRRIFIVDEHGEDLRKREISPEIANILAQLSPSTPYYRINVGEQAYAARYVLLPDGENLRIVSFSTPTHGRMVSWRLNFLSSWRLYLISILVSGTACLIFARHMSRDIHTLQKATQDIAKGDLSVRVAPQFASRKDEIAELSRDFDNMTARLEKSMHEQKRLIKDVSHELRSPLARLQFALSIAQQRSVDDSVQVDLEKVRHAADYLNDIITTILSFPTNETETWELQDTLDIRTLLETLCEEFEQEANEKGVKIVFKSHIEEALVDTYSNTLIGVFENVLRNALHYTLANTTIEVDLSSADDQIAVAIADQGPGVAEEELADIFEPFYRTDEARDRSSGGYGLGLSIAQRTVFLHGGTVNANNRRGGGLQVTVTLPCSEHSIQQSGQEQAHPAYN